jgi:hypothetical protein
VSESEVSGAGRTAGLGEVGWGWLIYLAILPPVLITYTRLPPLSTYHFNATGFVGGGLSRIVTETNYPIAMAAIPLAAISFARLGGRRVGAVTVAAVVLCLVAFVPGVNSVADLTARWINAPAVVGCGLALGVSAAAVRVCGGTLAVRRAGWDRLRLVLGAAVAVWSIPWLFAVLGTYVSDAPLLGHIFRAHQPTPGDPVLASVHLGLHEGLAGTQMVLAALLLSRTLRTIRRRPWLRASTSAYLGLLFSYGGIVSLNDVWNEQLVKRGTVDFQLPYLLTPSLGWGWAMLLLSAAAVHLLWFRREYLSVDEGPATTHRGDQAGHVCEPSPASQP